jgi:PAP2 superfamily
MYRTKKHRWMTLLVIAASLLAGPLAQADVVTNWNITAGDIAVAAKLLPPPAYRVMAMVQSAVYEAVNAITKRYPPDRVKLDAAPGASVEAAVAEANRATLSQLVPSQQAAIDSAYQAALSAIPTGQAKTAGLAVGEKAAAAILAWRAKDGATTGETYRPHTTAGVYVPTVIPAVPQWPQRTPWLMTSPTQFRPSPPPPLTSEVWARDYNEIKALGSKNSTRRTAEQTAIARFWEATMPPIYHGVVRSVATLPGRDVTQNARLFAAVTQAMDDALIAVIDAKYHYNLWRPITAIRNGDIDGNDATEREPSWTPFIDTPMHPEYPCAHCIVSGAVGTVLHAEVGTSPMPTLTTTSVTAQGAARRWTTIDAFMQEVANARIYDGVHYRTSTEVGTAMGKQIGELAVAKSLRSPK